MRTDQFCYKKQSTSKCPNHYSLKEECWHRNKQCKVFPNKQLLTDLALTPKRASYLLSGSHNANPLPLAYLYLLSLIEGIRLLSACYLWDQFLPSQEYQNLTLNTPQVINMWGAVFGMHVGLYLQKFSILRGTGIHRDPEVRNTFIGHWQANLVLGIIN